MPVTAKAFSTSPTKRITICKWLAVPNGNTGDPVDLRGSPDRSVQITGTFGAAGSVSLKGSNDGGTTWVILTDPLGNALTFAAAGLKQLTEIAGLIRPEVTAGDGTTALNVYLCMRGQ